MGQAIDKRIVSALLAVVQVTSGIVVAELATRAPARAAFACNAGNDGSPGTLSGTYNSYFIPATGTLSAGSTTVALSSATPDTGGGGASTAIAAGDELLIMQMQDGTFTNTNSSSYGTGASIGNAGLYEYVQVVSIAGTSVTIFGAGAGGGTVNNYTEAAATGTQGQRTYQVIRVPQYLTATLSSTFHAAYWDGQTGGVAALDIASTLNLGGATLYATGDGFRGGGVSVASTSPASVLNTDYVDSATMNGANPSTSPPGQGFKGEGIFGTPGYTFYYSDFSTPSTPTAPLINKATSGNGYPGGDMAMGAPGNAGGGGTDMNPSANDSNTGGGGGGNGGSGGNGGYPWSNQNPKYSQTSPALHAQANFAVADATHNPDLGGRGATAIATGVRAFMGGGGGAGSNNNGSQNNTFGADGSSGGTGGGVVMMRIANTSGSAATIFADGTTGLAPDNDGGGGGGAGGTIIITSPNTFTGITAYARGAAGTSAYFKTGDTTLTTAHGPGGGGGGGAIYTSSPVSATVTGGSYGVTVSGQAIQYGAQAGTAGVSSIISASAIPGVPSGAECYSSSGANTPYIGPYDSADTSGVNYQGAEYTGSYDGSVTATNNNDFTAVGLPLTNASTTPTNTGTVAGTWIGSSFTFSSAPTVNVRHEFYYKASTAGNVPVTFTATAPQLPGSWTVRLCPGTAAAPTCGTAANMCNNSNDDTFTTQNAAGVSSTTMVFCSSTTTTRHNFVWAQYTPAAGTYTAFGRYDATIIADDGTNSNTTHDEIYAGFVPITKTATVVTNGCPSGVTPPAGGICPGGVVRYTLDYRNVMVGGGLGSEGQLLSAFVYTNPGTLVVSDNGAATFTNGAATNNTATYTNGLASTLNAGGVYTTCSATAGTCGASQANTTFTGNSAASTSWTATIGGASFVLSPNGYATDATHNWQGTVIFAETVK